MITPTLKGFKAAGMASGIKPNGKKDLGILFSEVPAAVAGVFTRNRVKAAPVLLDQLRLQTGYCQGIIANSGNANCFTGEKGMTDAKHMARAVAAELNVSEELFMVASTGVIGQPLPIEKIETASPTMVRNLSSEGFIELAQAIMTTDTVPKLSFKQARIGKKAYSMVGVAKGAGMIRPDMATMLCFVCTDANVDNPYLQQALTIAVSRSFNRITVDGDTSTNDTALLLANGKSEASVITDEHKKDFQLLLDDLLMDLARQLIKDGEGVTKVVEVHVHGAACQEDAEKIADTVSHSPLVKTAFFGEDANWGRIMMAAGRAGAQLNPELVDIYFDQIQLVKKGRYCGKDAEEKTTLILKKPEFSVTLDLNLGTATTWMLTCDFSLDYIKINADYRS
ncbi:MAG: bifunctional glutamate N-acetyltransferase/amino-acid acetyltransferase ArgJ [Desulfobacteraceae bacterium]|jgi:glutamate N-acetyltransferase/amino-acid N-acetyltransferase